MKNYLVLALTLSLAACSQPATTVTSSNSSTEMPDTNTPAKLDQQQLQAYSWLLMSAIDAKGQRIDALFTAPEANKPITLNFEKNNLKLKNLFCNIHGLNIDFQNNQLSVKQPIVATMMGCPAEIEKMEQTMVDILTSKPSLDISGSTEQPILTLLTPKQEKLLFKGVPTPETRYGVQAETIFLELAPQTKICSAGVRQMQCLQVREVKYNEQGIKTYTGSQWQNFYDNIDGFKHNTNQQVIIRVNRYKVTNPPADASSYAYVLDTVIQQSNVKK